MSRKEVDRLAVIQQVAARQLRQRHAAELLGVGVRQVKRLLRRYRLQGAAGLISGHRTRGATNAFSEAFRARVLDLVREHYGDFGPTLACEKLAERHALELSVETLRQWMIGASLWRPKRRRRARVHQRRPRRPRYGELVQIDGSPHDWFEGRAPGCTLIVFIDDATSALQGLQFVPSETTRAYMEQLAQYLAAHGRPVALYSDKHSIFRVNHPEHEGEITQFTRAIKTLDIEPIHANTPQAKGRVERANLTLQDRLVKELRLAGISDMAAANAFLPRFMRAYNKRFAIEPRDTRDAHRPVLHDDAEVRLILSLHHLRTLSKNLCCQFQGRELQLDKRHHSYQMRGAKITVCEAFDGQLTLLYKGRPLEYRTLATSEPPIPLDDEKSVQHTVDQARRDQASRKSRKSPPDHPWRQWRPSPRQIKAQRQTEGTF